MHFDHLFLLSYRASLKYHPAFFQLKNKFMKKLPRDAEASNVLVGEVDFLDSPFVAFVRLQQAVMLGALTEVPVPTRYDPLSSHKAKECSVQKEAFIKCVCFASSALIFLPCCPQISVHSAWTQRQSQVIP